MIVKINVDPVGNKKIVAICDKELVGKTFEEGELILDLNCGFFKGDEKTNDEILEIIKKSDGLNVVGEKSIEFLIENDYIDNGSVGKISGVPYAHVVVIREDTPKEFKILNDESEEE